MAESVKYFNNGFVYYEWTTVDSYLAHHTSDPTGTGQNAGNTILEHRCTCEEFLIIAPWDIPKGVKCQFFLSAVAIILDGIVCWRFYFLFSFHSFLFLWGFGLEHELSSLIVQDWGYIKVTDLNSAWLHKPSRFPSKGSCSHGGLNFVSAAILKYSRWSFI